MMEILVQEPLLTLTLAGALGGFMRSAHGVYNNCIKGKQKINKTKFIYDVGISALCGAVAAFALAGDTVSKLTLFAMFTAGWSGVSFIERTFNVTKSKK